GDRVALVAEEARLVDPVQVREPLALLVLEDGDLVRLAVREVGPHVGPDAPVVELPLGDERGERLAAAEARDDLVGRLRAAEDHGHLLALEEEALLEPRQAARDAVLEAPAPE